MVDLEEAKQRLFQHLRREIKDERVLQAMARVPRELFVPISSRNLAYEDIPLPIDRGQTISQPFIVALMTEALELIGTDKVLEIGTGSGYQTAILAELAWWVVTVERHQELADAARKLLAELGYTNIEVHLAERTLGWRKAAPYQAIIVTAGTPKVPQELLDQLAEGGRMLIPVGSRYEQELLKIVRRKGELLSQDLGPCRWVPLIGEGAWDEEW
jgi:protein-L-isoaspartate(D-aspartate) O-methyltransferase